MKGIFYNSEKALCSIWESGKMCYDALSKSSNYILDYSEEQNTKEINNLYDFVIINQHFAVNNWINSDILKNFGKISFCIVTEVGLGINPINSVPNIFDHYIVLDPTIEEKKNIHAFVRPLEDFLIDNVDCVSENEIPKIGSFGFATYGKEWHKIVECVQNEFDNAEVYLNIPKATYVPDEIHNFLINEIKMNCNKIINKPGIILYLTHNNLSKKEIIEFCKKNTINCFFYNRNCKENPGTGLAAVTDQAIVSEKPILISDDITFRHIHKYINFYPNIGIKEAIIKNKEGVLKMKQDWSSKNFLVKFEKILFK